jgi:hypothetical protein
MTKKFQRSNWLRFTRQGLALVILALVALDLALHIGTPPVHGMATTPDQGVRFSDATGAPAPEDQAPCGIPGHCSGATHHHHFATAFGITHIGIGAAIMAPAEWAQSRALSYTLPTATQTRAPPSI